MIRIAAVFLVASLCACSSSSSGSTTDPADGGDDDAAVESPGPDAGTSPVDSGSSAAAGKAGVEAFCTAICDHEQTCAGSLDASPPGLADCASNCVTANESASASPPTELLRADYLAAVGACIAKADCSQDLASAEAACAGQVVTGMGASLTPTQAVAALCHDLETTACTASDAGTTDCVTNLLPYSDVALSAAVACFPGSSCSALATCYVAAFTQM